METDECIRKRRSVRWFDGKFIPDEHVEKILQAASLAPSAGNRQEWAFIVIKDENLREKVKTAVTQIQRNTFWYYLKLRVGGKPLEQLCQDLSEMSGRNVSKENVKQQEDLEDLLNQLNERDTSRMFKAGLIMAAYHTFNVLWTDTPQAYDLGAAIQNILLTATSLGYGSLWAGGFFRQATKTEWREANTTAYPYYKDYISDILGVPKDWTLAALIFIGKPHKPPAPGQKKSFNEITYLNKYGNRWSS